MSSNNSDSGDTSGGNLAIAIVSVIAVGVVVIVVAFLIYKCCKICMSRKYGPPPPLPGTADGNVTLVNETTTISRDSIKIEMGSGMPYDVLKNRPIRFSSQQLQEFTQNYAEKLGAGGFGVVSKGQLPNGMPVAVKVLSNNMGKRAEEQFMAEIGTIGRTSHVNLVRLYGFCFDATVKALVYEFMENGSLERYLFDAEEKIGFDKLYDIAVGTAKAIRYLHDDCAQRIIHYDIKPGNVLLSGSFAPKVADFGLAKLFDRENTHVTITGGRGTPGYAAPELWMPFPVTHKCDVYSYGMLLFEILGRRRNLELGKELESQEWYPKWIWQKFEQGEIEAIISQTGAGKADREKAERMCKVALWCVQYKPEDRPSMSNVVRMLEGKEEIVAPNNPFAYMAPFSFNSIQSTDTTTESYSSGLQQSHREMSTIML